MLSTLIHIINLFDFFGLSKPYFAPPPTSCLSPPRNWTYYRRRRRRRGFFGGRFCLLLCFPKDVFGETFNLNGSPMTEEELRSALEAAGKSPLRVFLARDLSRMYVFGKSMHAWLEIQKLNIYGVCTSCKVRAVCSRYLLFVTCFPPYRDSILIDFLT